LSDKIEKKHEYHEYGKQYGAEKKDVRQRGKLRLAMVYMSANIKEPPASEDNDYGTQCKSSNPQIFGFVRSMQNNRVR